VHFDDMQFSVPWFMLHAAAHAPQFFTSFVVLTSQPVDASPSQSAKPAAHVILHAPAVQLPVPPT
jgi:hypothetical protein